MPNLRAADTAKESFKGLYVPCSSRTIPLATESPKSTNACGFIATSLLVLTPIRMRIGIECAVWALPHDHCYCCILVLALLNTAQSGNKNNIK
jgi:hypothetical protein